MSTESCVGARSIASLKVIRTVFTRVTPAALSMGSVAITVGPVQSRVRLGVVSGPVNAPVSVTVPRRMIVPQFADGVFQEYGDWSPARAAGGRLLLLPPPLLLSPFHP